MTVGMEMIRRDRDEGRMAVRERVMTIEAGVTDYSDRPNVM